MGTWLTGVLRRGHGDRERRRVIDVGWLVDADKSGFIYESPRIYQRKARPQPSVKAVGHCPAVLDYEARHVEIPCPVDMHLRLGKDDSGQYRLHPLPPLEARRAPRRWQSS